MAKKSVETITQEDVGELKIVEGAGVAAYSKLPKLGKLIESAMAEAVQQCYADGVMDPDVQRAKMQEARERVKKEYAEAVEKATAEYNAKLARGGE